MMKTRHPRGFSISRIICAIVVLNIAGGGSAWAAGFGINEHSAAAMGMAGAYTAIADNASAGFFNPAGLSTVDGFDIEAGLTWIGPSMSYKGIVPSTGNESEVDGAKLNFYIPNFHVSYRFFDSVALGISTYTPYGLSTEWPTEMTVDGKQVSWWARGMSKKIAIETFYINPNFAAKLHERVHVGVGITIAQGAVAVNRAVTLSSSAQDDIDVEMVGEDTTVGANAGLLVEVLPKLLNVGVAYRSGVSFAFSGKAAFTKGGSSDNIPAGLRTRLTDGRVESDFELPHVVSFGLGAFPVEGLKLGFALDVITWSSYEKMEVRFLDNPELSSSEPKDWQNTICVRLGAEYRVLPYLPVRVGFIFDQSPIPTDTVGPDLPDGDRWEFTLGLGYQFKGIRADVAYQFLTTGDIEASETAPLLGTYRSSAHLVGLSLGYNWAL